MSYVNKINIGNGTHLIEPTLFAEVSNTSTASAYSANIDNFSLVEGTVVHIKFNNTANSSGATLNISTSGANVIRYEGMAIPANSFVNSRIYSFVCTKENNTYYWELLNDLPTDDRIEIVDMT